MGFAIARAARNRADVTLVADRSTYPTPRGVRRLDVNLQNMQLALDSVRKRLRFSYRRLPWPTGGPPSAEQNQERWFRSGCHPPSSPKTPTSLAGIAASQRAAAASSTAWALPPETTICSTTPGQTRAQGVPPAGGQHRPRRLQNGTTTPCCWSMNTAPPGLPRQQAVSAPPAGGRNCP